MKIPKHPTLLRRMRDARLKRLLPRCVPLGASLGRQRGGGWHLTVKEDGKTRTVYVPKELLQEVRASLREHRRLRQLLREITRLELARIRLHLTEKRRRGTRR
jgi:hypothetical protein